MSSLLRLFPSFRATPKAPAMQRDSVEIALTDGRCIDILRVRDPRARRIKLAVDERGARLTLPLRASRAEGERFLHEHRAWLTQQLALQAQAGGDGLRRDVTGTLPLRGRVLPLRWESGRATRLEQDAAGELRFLTPARAGDGALRRALQEFYEAEGRADLGRWLPSYLPGLPHPPRRIVFKRPSTLWGSLAPDGTVVLDLALLLAQPAAFEYVLVHELCHLLHRDHSPHFWHAVGLRFPDWREQRAYLREEGRGLKARLRRLLAG